ncbi:MAG: GAF domain-containing protein [Calditrichaeota bacterium]|nr:MAG: GAF domain-containing protein [Calditrichota bacterium]
MPELISPKQDEISYLKYKLDRLSSLIEVSIIINSTLDLDEVMILVMEKAQSVMGAEASSIFLINEQTGKLECEIALGEVGPVVKEKIELSIGEGIAGWCVQSTKPLIVPDAKSDSRFAKKMDEETGFKTRSILAVPLKVRNKIIGVAEVINPVRGREFTQDDLDLFSTFGRQVALAIENARLHKTSLEKQKIEQQLDAARIIQESFMPQTAPTSKDHRFEVAAKSIAATAIGGDFYDFAQFEEDTLGVFIGDVSGKGIPAALYMARLVSDFRFHTQLTREPEETIKAINNLLVERGRRGMFVTLQYTILNILTGLATIITGGHLPALCVRAATQKCEIINSEGGVPLGILPDAVFPSTEIQLQHGDYLIFFTDGITEAKNLQDKQYSLERVVTFLEKKWTSADEIVDALITSINDFASDARQHDDITLVVLKWC